MALNSQSKPKKQGAIPPAGLQLAVCYAIIDLGTQEEQFPGKPATLAQKVHYSWELPNLPFVSFGEGKAPQPMALFNEYTVSAGDKAKLPKMLCSWGNMDVKALKGITSDFLKAFLGQPCMLSVIHENAKTAVDSETGRPIIYAKIGGNGLMVMPRMQEIPKPAGTINPIKFLDLDAFDWTVYGSLPQFIQEKIAKSKEWPGILAKYPRPAEATQQAYSAPAQNPANVMADNSAPVVSGPSIGASF